MLNKPKQKGSICNQRHYKKKRQGSLIISASWSSWRRSWQWRWRAGQGPAQQRGGWCCRLCFPAYAPQSQTAWKDESLITLNAVRTVLNLQYIFYILFQIQLNMLKSTDFTCLYHFICKKSWHVKIWDILCCSGQSAVIHQCSYYMNSNNLLICCFSSFLAVENLGPLFNKANQLGFWSLLILNIM